MATATDTPWRPVGPTRTTPQGTEALIEWAADGRQEWRRVRVTVERKVTSGDGAVVACNEAVVCA